MAGNVFTGSKTPNGKIGGGLPKAKPDVTIEFTKNLINPYMKLFPSTREVQEGVYMVASRDEEGNKISLGKDERGFEQFQYEPALDANGNTIPVQKNAQGKALPLIIDIRTIPDKANQRSPFEAAIMARSRVDVSLPNEDASSNLRKRNVTIPASFLQDNGNTLIATLKPAAYKDGIKVNVPTDPYIVDASGNEVRVQAEKRDYTNSTGATTKKLMAPVGFSNGQPVWDDGKTIIAKAGSEKAASLQAQGKDVVTYDTAVKYHYTSTSITINELKSTLESYKNNNGKDIQADYGDADLTKSSEASMEGPEV
jgi:hypothetical protein